MINNLSIIIPVYNEEKAIAETIRFFEDFIVNNPATEVIFINDASTDNTAGILGAVNNEKIRIITQDRNRGYGAAIKAGVKAAGYDTIAITDADASYPHDKIAILLENLIIQDAGMAVGARTGQVVEIGFARKTAKFILRKLAEMLSEEKIPDLNSGLRVIKKGLVLEYLPFLPNGFSFTTTITLALLANDHKVIYLPIDYYKRKGKSKINPFKEPFNFLQLIIRVVMFFNPLKVFLPLAIFFFVAAFSVLIVTALQGKVMDISSIVLFATGLNLLAIGLLADLIDKRLRK